MKFFAVPILIFLLASQAFSKWVLLLEFRWNQEYIAQNLCENRAKPQLKCGGKCVLMKKMAADEKESSSQQPNAKSRFQEVLFPFEPTGPAASRPAEKSRPVFTPYLLRKYTSPPLSIFHPPA